MARFQAFHAWLPSCGPFGTMRSIPPDRPTPRPDFGHIFAAGAGIGMVFLQILIHHMAERGRLTVEIGQSGYRRPR